MMPATIQTMRPAMSAGMSRSFAPRRPKLSQELSAVNKRILGAGSMLFAALVPAIWSGSQSAAILGIESVLCLCLLGMRSRAHRNLWSTWELRSQEVLRGAAAVVEAD